ncbi:proteoglycan 4b [Notothenia coriiceps]|uniref:Proteoglycan 4b n=1 Tax=Notothenia coriiceps TaxID=8208 RepID=A0A6I9Q7A0_9TELE|nr:PREDICTED: proteoglycan 4 [Notothenia coriiceps]
MSSTVLCAVTLLACALTFGAAQTSCKGRCGAEYYRGNMCQCDYGCLEYGECCRDYESQCTTKNSCKGRCGEGFKRGRLCNCDSDCIKFKQCCPDRNLHCDADEPTLNDASDPSTFSEENHADDNSIPLVSPTSNPQDDLGDDMYNQIFPTDEFSNNGVEDPEAGPVPQSTSSYELSTADVLDQISTEPTQDPDPLPLSTEAFTTSTETQTTLPDTEKDADFNPSTLNPTESKDASDASTAGTTTAAAVSSQPPPTTAPQSDPSPTADTQELQAEGQAEVQTEDDNILGETTVAYPEDPEVTTLSTASYTPVASGSTGPPQSSTTVLEDSQGTTISSVALDLTPITEATPSNPGPDDAENTDSVPTDPTSSLADPDSSSVSPEEPGDLPELDTLTTQTPLFTEAVQDDTTNEDAARVTTADPLDVTPDPTVYQLDVTPDPTADPLDVTPDPTDDLPNVTPDPTADLPNATPDPNADLPNATPDLNADRPNATPDPNADLPNSTPDPTADQLNVTPDPNADLPNATPDPTADQLDVTPDPTKNTPLEATPKPQDKPAPNKPSQTIPTSPKPSYNSETKPLIPTQTLTIDNPKEYQADDSNDTNLCSGRPIGAVTTLRNGTMVVFRGHYFWLVDRYMVPSPAQSITQVWGVPSPIDTAFTRCNCQGKTYIFKGPRYWRFENGLLDPHYPKVVQVGFDGLRGQITAALSVPQYQSRRESVYFFKRGGTVQKYSYQLGASPTCGRKVNNAVYTVRSRVVRQAVSLLGPSIKIRTSWRGFPSTITAAVSVPSRTEPEGYKYHVFSRSTSYTVRMGGELPVVPAPTAKESPQNRDFFKCQKKV